MLPRQKSIDTTLSHSIASRNPWLNHFQSEFSDANRERMHLLRFIFKLSTSVLFPKTALLSPIMTWPHGLISWYFCAAILSSCSLIMKEIDLLAFRSIRFIGHKRAIMTDLLSVSEKHATNTSMELFAAQIDYC